MGPLIFGETEVLQQLCRYSAEEYARKFGSAPAAENLTNDIDDAKPLAKEEGSLLNTVVEIAMKFVPLIIDTLAGSTGPSQTDRFFLSRKNFSHNFTRIEGIDLNGEDPFSLRNIAYLGLKLFLAVAGGTSSGIDKSDTVSVLLLLRLVFMMILCQVSPLQPVMGAVIGALTGSDDPNEVAVMAKQASEVEISDLSSPSSSTTTPTIHIHNQPNHPHPYPWPKPHPDEILTLS